ncbi:DUF397 domain-containing protein [Actinomadura gamaensis]|uniref:DUF397 domain-containing protein n=1 Tax=Actinomadura gamaensis TaxID=1763541 RepID=A0ABV9U4H4_9ACTN
MNPAPQDIQSELDTALWTKSSHSGSGDQCVEVAALSGARRAVRDSKDPDGPALLLASGEWHAMLERVHDR